MTTSAWFAIPMLLGGGLFAGGAVSIAWERTPVWRDADLPDFRSAFAHTLRRVDRLQPVLLAACLTSTIGFALSSGGAPRTSAVVAAGGFLTVLVGSASWLVPIQRRLVATVPERSPLELERLKAQWLRGHMIRTVVALAPLTLAVLAAVS